MPARIRNFIVERGGDFYRRINVTDSAGLPVDLTSGYGATLIATAAAEDETAPLFTLTDGNGLTLGVGYIDIGVGKAVLSALDLSALPAPVVITEPAPNDEPDYVGEGKAAHYRLLVTGPADFDDDCVLRGQICFANR